MDASSLQEPSALFVYGTLAPGRPNHHLLADIEGRWLPAILRGHLLDEGWGAAMGYPGIIPADDGGEVQGFIFVSSELSAKWPMLDEFEGEAYRRIVVNVVLESGATQSAFVYAIDSKQDGDACPAREVTGHGAA